MRKTYHYDPETKEMVEGPSPRRGESSGDGWRFSDRNYDGLRAPDGTDISSRKKHRDYMRKNNLTTIDDFKDQWKQEAKKREDFFSGNWDREGRKRDIAYAFEKSRKGE